MGLLDFDPNQAMQRISTPQGAMAMGLLARGDERLGPAVAGAMGDMYQQQQAMQAYKLQQMQMQQIMQRRQQEEAARQWAEQQGMGGMPEWAQQAQFKAKFNRPADDPSSVREWQYFNSLQPEDQERYLTMKRAQKFLDLGNRFAAPSPVDPRVDRLRPPMGAQPLYQNQAGNTLPQLPAGQSYLDAGEALSPASPYQPAGRFAKGLPPQSQPSVQAAQAAAKKRASTMAEHEAQREIDFPKVKSQVEYSVALLDDLIDHAGMSGSVGMKGSSYMFGAKDDPFSGTPEAGFMARLDQIKGKQFLEAFESLKGGGQITEIEGKKAEQAQARMSTAQSEADFTRAVNEFRSILLNGLRRKSAEQGIRYQYQRPEIDSGRVIDFNDLPED